MLNIPQLAQIKGRDTYLYESLTQVVAAVNSLGRATGVDPTGAIAAASFHRSAERAGRRRDF